MVRRTQRLILNRLNFFRHVDDFFNYRQDIYDVSPQTLKSNRVDLDLFKNFICSQNLESLEGPNLIDFQFSFWCYVFVLYISCLGVLLLCLVVCLRFPHFFDKISKTFLISLFEIIFLTNIRQRPQ